MMTRAKGATLAEIIAATAWLPHTVRGFVSILGSKGGQKIESSKNAAGDQQEHPKCGVNPQNHLQVFRLAGVPRPAGRPDDSERVDPDEEDQTEHH
jgi:hypothetical protein